MCGLSASPSAQATVTNRPGRRRSRQPKVKEPAHPASGESIFLACGRPPSCHGLTGPLFMCWRFQRGECRWPPSAGTVLLVVRACVYEFGRGTVQSGAMRWELAPFRS